MCAGSHGQNVHTPDWYPKCPKCGGSLYKTSKWVAKLTHRNSPDAKCPVWWCSPQCGYTRGV